MSFGAFLYCLVVVDSVFVDTPKGLCVWFLLRENKYADSALGGEN